MRRWYGVLVSAGLALGVAGAVQPAEAQVTQRVGVIVKISADPSVGGTAIGAATGTIGGAPVSINKASWTDTHAKQSPLFEGGVGIPASRNVEVLGLINYGHAGGNGGVIIGTVAGAPISANFDNYAFWGMDAGVRVHPSTGMGLYGMAAGGFRHVNELQATLFTNAAVRTVTGYDASTVPTMAVGGGVLFGEKSFALGIEVAVRYAGAPSVSSSLTVTPASGAGARWSLPVGVVFRF